MRSFALAALAVAVALLALSSCVVEAAPLRLSPSHKTLLTHEPSYTPPAPPSDIFAYASQQYEMLDSDRRHHGGGEVFGAPPEDFHHALESAAQLPHCSECQLFMQVAEWVAESNSSMTLVEAVLDGLCEKLRPNSTHCAEIASLIVNIGEKVPYELQHVGIYEPIRACSFLGLCSVTCCSDDTTPQQVALGIGRNDAEMHVSWVTGGNETESVVEYGTDPHALVQASKGYILTYTEGGWLGYIHRVVMTDLEVDTTYYYRVGGAASPSDVFNFTTVNNAALSTPFTIGIVGDMAVNDNDWSPLNIAYLNAAVESGVMQAVIHIGDISYADGYMASWDQFFQVLQPTMTRVPYQVIPGNHEILFSYAAYLSRFFTSGLGADPIVPGTPLPTSGPSGTNLYSSYDIGCVHFIALCSEDWMDTAQIDDTQLAWLENDLNETRTRMESAANTKATATDDEVTNTTCSSEAPTFLVVYLHRPLYCSDSDSDNCGGTQSQYLQARLEDLFMSYGVDLVFYGHMHNYERTVPTYANEPNAEGPIYVLNGAGGNREGIVNEWTAAPSWSAIRASVVGVGELTIVDGTTLEWTFAKQLNQSGETPLANVQQIDAVTLTARNRTTAAREERESRMKKSHEHESISFVDDLVPAVESASTSSLEFVSLADPSWFFSPYNWRSSELLDLSSSSYIQSNNPGAYIKVAFTGTSFELQLNTTNTPASDYMTLRWSIDDGDYQSATLPSSLASDDTLVLASGLPSGSHTLVLFLANSLYTVDRWEVPLNVVRVTGAWIDQGSVLKEYPLIHAGNLLVFWDSIGEGILVNGRIAFGPTSALENNDALKNWVQVLAESLKVEVGSVCFGGQGWLNQGSAWPIMSPNDTDAGHAWSHYSAGASRLDEEGLLVPQPDLVLMGHGTNDLHAQPSEVQLAALKWLSAIRDATGPEPAVFLAVPFGDYQREAIIGAFDEYAKSSDASPNTYLLSLDSYGASEGLTQGSHPGRISADGLHPLAWRAEQLGGMLAVEIERLLTEEEEAAATQL